MKKLIKGIIIFILYKIKFTGKTDVFTKEPKYIFVPRKFIFILFFLTFGLLIMLYKSIIYFFKNYFYYFNNALNEKVDYNTYCKSKTETIFDLYKRF